MTDIDRYRLRPGKRVKLAGIDPEDTALVPGGKKASQQKNAKHQERLAELQEVLFAERRRKVLIVLQGMDTSGKDGTVRHVMGGFNPTGVHVVSFKKPTETELAHDFLWRIHTHVPVSGEIAVFNRSQYEDVLVPRVHELVPKKVIDQRYGQINDFERMLVENDTVVLKFFLHISKDEQRKRLQERIDDPTKRWKFQHGDIEERKLWPAYQKAYETLLEKTSTEAAPWWIVPADAKWYRNWLVGEVVVRALEELKMKYPEPDLSGVVIE